ncbi:MAG TPA: PEP/pyruvate-binding domain-containing protein [Vicinamibacterales bacterium]|nr:PEP/pyruvate-binding domain-containing protein [Vicinamibacterales bacterium]
MTQRTDGSVDKIMDALRERAKELHCLYKVHELLNRPDMSVQDVCHELLVVLPPGWQFPDACFARITLNGVVYEPTNAGTTSWVQKADLVVHGHPVGSIEIFYTEPVPEADEGPFLKEERKLIDTIAERLSEFVAQRQVSRPPAAGEERPHVGEWRIILDFLRKTDQPLVGRIGRRLLNYLSWHGIAEAQAMLQRAVPQLPDNGGPDENRPIERKAVAPPVGSMDEAFEIAARHLPGDEIVSCIEKWIKEDKSAFLIEAVEHQHTSLADIGHALDRYEHFAASDRELSRAVQIGLRVSLARRLLSDDVEFVNRAKTYIEVEDYYQVLQHTIAPASSHGKLGGKSSGLLLATAIVRRAKEYADALGHIRVPRTWYMTSDGVLSFIEHNQLEDVHNHKYLEVEQIRREYPHIVQVFKHSQFPPELVHGLALALDEFGDVPLIVRSSSLLEDRMGAAFSGKYKSLFLANQGTKRERLAALMDAIAEVYASVFGPDPIEYRANRGLLDFHEEMGILIQEVVGARVGPFYLPAFAGVAFSNNEFRWSPRIVREDGLLRLVPGLGTRAVDRVSDDYPVLVAPGKPGLRVNVTPDEVDRYSPKKVDVLNMESGRFETVPIVELLKRYGLGYPMVRQIVSILDEGGVHRPAPFGWDPARVHPVVTFDGLVRDTPFIPQMRALLRVLRERLETPVDIEFASDGRDFYLLQCRPQSFLADAAPVAVPRDVPSDRVLFSSRRFVSNGRVPDLTHIVYVDPDGYLALPTFEQLFDVARAVGRLNKLLPRRQFVLIGPGRWGSRGDIRLGVRVTYSDINNAAMLMEVAARRGSYVPEVSFGTHFFQDLVESSIRYLPIFPGEPRVLWNEAFLRTVPSVLTDILPEYAHLSDCLRVIDVPRATGGLILRVLMNADTEEALGMFAVPSGAIAGALGLGPGPEPRPAAPITDEHWRWRLGMAERIAMNADPQRFGIKAMYVFGSAKNATAGPSSDIDLLVHFSGTDDQRRALELWLEGWSSCLSELNYLRTGRITDGLLDVHIITDDDIARQSSYAVKINAVTDPARPLKLRVR